MFGKRKVTEETAQNACCGGAQVKESKSEPTHANAESARILVLGAGCPKCRALEQTVTKALEEMNLSEAVGHVTDYAEMAKYGVMSTPALVIDGKVVSAGRVLNRNDVVKFLHENL